MPKLYNLIKDNDTRNSVLFSLVVGILNYIGKRYALINKSISISVYISLFSIILFFILKNIIKEIKDGKEKGFGLSANLYPKKHIKIAKISSFLIYSLLIFPCYFSISSTITFIEKKNIESASCIENLKKTGLFIANFNKSKDENDDDFSSTLFGRLDSYLQNSDTINLKQIKKFISYNNHSYIDTIRETFSENCSNEGLLIFGKRQDEKLFDCRIYSLNFFNFRTNSFQTKNKTIIYIQNPDILNFSIEYEATIISKFIFGLLYYHEGKYELSNSKIEEALNLNKNKENKPFVSICNLFIGNNLLKEGKLSDAVDEYKKGILNDSTNAYLHYNIAAIYDKFGNNNAANNEYNTAEKLNKNLKNPLTKNNNGNVTTLKNVKEKVNFESTDSVQYKSQHESFHVIQDEGKWDESFNAISENGQFGIVNNRGDVIVQCLYQEVEKRYIYKNRDCFIVKIDNSYGAIIHTHLDDGYTIYKIPVVFTHETVEKIIKRWIDDN